MIATATATWYNKPDCLRRNYSRQFKKWHWLCGFVTSPGTCSQPERHWHFCSYGIVAHHRRRERLTAMRYTNLHTDRHWPRIWSSADEVICIV